MSKEHEMIETAINRCKNIQEIILHWASDNLSDFPWRKNRTPYKVIVAEFLLKRTTATAVERVYEDFIEKYPNIESLAKADVKELENFLKTIGYHKLRSNALKETVEFIKNNLNGKIPENMEGLMLIPNIGSYTAGAILSLGYGQKAPMVDSNVERIYMRIFKKSLPKKAVMRGIYQVAEILVPDTKHEIFNSALLDLGRLICTYREPYCNRCALKKLCDTAILGNRKIS